MRCHWSYRLQSQIPSNPYGFASDHSLRLLSSCCQTPASDLTSKAFAGMTGCLLMNVANKVSPLALPCLLLLTSPLFAEPVPVRHTEGLVHGFLVLRTIDGKTVAEGDQTEI